VTSRADYDLVVIGGGNTGQAAANRVARAGKRVALVDQGPVGGLCSLAGCNPKKVLVRASEVLEEVRRAGQHGISTGPVAIDWSKVIDRKRTFTDPVTAATEAGLAQLGVARATGVARFIGPDRVQVGAQELGAAAFVIATGSRPRQLTFPGAEHVKITNDLLDLREVPRRLVILGAGVVALEFGFVFARLGSQVVVVARGDRALTGFDRDFVAPVVAFAERLGIRWLWNREARAVQPADGALVVDVGDETLPADFVLNASGRTANVEALDLGRGDVAGGPRGIEVDEYLQSRTNPSVFAGGDAHGEWQLSPVASYEGRIISRNLLVPRSARVDYTALPRAVFTTPPLATVGLTEEAARARQLDVLVAQNDMATWKVFAIAGDEAARSKLVVDRASGKLLGAQLWTPTAPDMIHFLALAIRFGMTRAELEDLVYAYPTPTSALANAWM
jgi:glutathione reductase (NADPH)